MKVLTAYIRQHKRAVAFYFIAMAVFFILLFFLQAAGGGLGLWGSALPGIWPDPGSAGLPEIPEKTPGEHAI